MFLGGRAVMHGGAAALIAAACLGAVAPPAPPVRGGDAAVHSSPSQASSDVTAEERAALRERLERRAAELDARAQLMRQAVKMLDAGEPVDDVRRFMANRTAVARMLGDAGAGAEIRLLEGERPRGPGPGPGPHAHDHAAGRPDRQHLTPEERDVIREMLAVTAPEKVEELDNTDSNEAGQKWGRLAVLARPMMELKRRDPDLYALRLERMRYETRAIHLAGKIARREAADPRDEAEIASLRAQLQEAGGRVFDIRIAEQAHEIAMLQSRLDTIRADIASQEARREQVIAEQTDKLLRGATQWVQESKHGPRDDAGLPRPGKPKPRGSAGPVPVSDSPR